MIYSPYGNEIRIIARSGSGKMNGGEMITAVRVHDKQEREYVVSELRADAGIQEIAETVENAAQKDYKNAAL